MIWTHFGSAGRRLAARKRPRSACGTCSIRRLNRSQFSKHLIERVETGGGVILIGQRLRQDRVGLTAARRHSRREDLRSMVRELKRIIAARERVEAALNNGEDGDEQDINQAADPDDILSKSFSCSIYSEHALYAFTIVDTDERNQFLALAKSDGWTWRRFAYQGTAGDRNVHQMSGRVV
jgi:hypothetical protein